MYNDEAFLQVKQEFETYYNKKIKPELEKLEAVRKKYLKIFTFLCLMVSLWCGFLFTNFKNIMNLPDWIELSSCIAVFVACVPMLSYYMKTKSSMLHLFANFFGKFLYNHDNMLSETVLNKSMIVDKHNIMRTEDGFSGVYKGVDVHLREYSLYEKQRVETSNYNDLSKIKNKKICRGIIFYAQMNKTFSGQTIIVKDSGIFNKFITYKNMKRVNLESVEFEKLFEVYSDDQIETRYILTTVMLEYLVELKNKFKSLSFSFFDNHVLINIKTNKNLFECNSFFTTLINKKRIYKTLEEMYILFSIIETLKINQDKN